MISMNELESYITQRASDFPLAAQFLYPQPDSSAPPAAPLIEALAAVLGDVVTSSPPLFANLARRTLSDLCRLRSVGNIKNIIDHVEREFRLEPGTLQSRCKTQRIALARQIAYYLCRIITGSSFPTIGESLGRDHSSIHHGFYLIQDRMARDAAFRLSIEKMERQLLASTTTTISAAA
jgi:chromosomal replication initiation ATPase DnaA